MKPDVRDAIRRLPSRSEVRTPDRGRAVDVAPLAAPAGPSNFPKIRAEPSEPSEGRHALEAGLIKRAIPAPRELEPLSADRFAVRFTADTEFRELLEEVRALASHREPDGDLLSLVKRGLEAYRRELQKER